MKNELNHGYEKGDKVLYQGGVYAVYVTYLGYSQLDEECFIAEDADGDVSDDWLWSEIVGE